MADEHISVDEFLHARKDHAKGNVLLKAARSRPSSWDEKTRSCRFVMSAEVEDRDRDIVIQEGLDLTEFLKNPVVPFSHASSTFPVGTWGDVEQLLNGRPKRTEGTATLMEEGKDGVVDRLAFHMAGGSIRAASIGFIPRKVRRREETEDGQGSYRYPGYYIEEAELIECSIVVIPSNPAALAKSAEGGDLFALETIEMVLDTWAKTEAGLIVKREDFERAHKEATGERTWIVLNPSAEQAQRMNELKNAAEPIRLSPAPPIMVYEPTLAECQAGAAQSAKDGLLRVDGHGEPLGSAIAQQNARFREGLFSRFLSWLSQDKSVGTEPATPFVPTAATTKDLAETLAAPAWHSSRVGETHAHDAELQKAVEEAELRLLRLQTETLERRLAQQGVAAAA